MNQENQKKLAKFGITPKSSSQELSQLYKTLSLETIENRDFELMEVVNSLARVARAREQEIRVKREACNV